MHAKLTLLMAQINPTVGAIAANKEKIIHIIEAHQDQYDLIVFPELALSGYTPEDLLLRKEFYYAIEEHLKAIQEKVNNCYVIVGHPSQTEGRRFNTLSILHQGQLIKTYHKQHLPNYGVFDEARYFSPGAKNPCTLDIQGYKLGFCICEDLWQPGPVDDLLAEQVQALVAINASPFDYKKYEKRIDLLEKQARKGLSIIYVNQIGGQDELVFDGSSFAMNNKGILCARAPAFEENLCPVTLSKDQLQGPLTPLLEKEALIYKALVCGLRDYVQKNNFPGVLLGLSGGIDSALTLCLAVDALGADKVMALLMPSRFSASISADYALQQLQHQQVKHELLTIEPAFQSLLTTLLPTFPKPYKEDITEENLQARIRGLFLMALSNKTGNMVLTTSNKSETAVGYATLYGDMAGGFAVLKDVLKTQVYALAHYRNTLDPVIPQGVITRAPSAELKANQTDQDNLPDYAILDAILVAYMEESLTPSEIIARGFKKDLVNKVLLLLKRSEYKRRQAAPGVIISPMAFGKAWRYPITQGYY